MREKERGKEEELNLVMMVIDIHTHRKAPYPEGLVNAELRTVEAGEAELRTAEAVEAELRQAELRKAEKREAKSGKAERREAELGEFWPEEAEAGEAELRKAEPGKAGLREAHAGENRAQAELAQAGEARRGEAELREAELREAEAVEAELRKAELRKAEAGEAELRKAEAGEAELRKAEAVEAELRKAEGQKAELGEFWPELGQYYSVGIHPWEIGEEETAEIGEEQEAQARVQAREGKARGEEAQARGQEARAREEEAQAWGLEGQLRRVEELARRPEVLAIGECGVDLVKGGPLFRQLQIFKKHVEISEAVGKPLILHVVKATDIIMGLKRDLNPSQPWIIHGFRGKPQTAGMLLKAGILLSFGAKFNPETVASMPAGSILAETDDSPESIYSVIASLSEAAGRDLTAEIIAATGRVLRLNQ